MSDTCPVWVPAEKCDCPWKYCGEVDKHNNPPDPCSFGKTPMKQQPSVDAAPSVPSEVEALLTSALFVASGGCDNACGCGCKGDMWCDASPKEQADIVATLTARIAELEGR